MEVEVLPNPIVLPKNYQLYFEVLEALLSRRHTTYCNVVKTETINIGKKITYRNFLLVIDSSILKSKGFSFEMSNALMPNIDLNQFVN